MAGITAFEGPKPRVYDFRHTFATECICLGCEKAVILMQCAVSLRIHGTRPL